MKITFGIYLIIAGAMLHSCKTSLTPVSRVRAAYSASDCDTSNPEANCNPTPDLSKGQETVVAAPTRIASKGETPSKPNDLPNDGAVVVSPVVTTPVTPPVTTPEAPPVLSVPLPPEATGNWYAAWGLECAGFCKTMGQRSVQSPDDYPVTFEGHTYQNKGSTCASGELVPKSAQAAWREKRFDFKNGCWWGPCPNGAEMHIGYSVKDKCYGVAFDGRRQKQDGDKTDVTAACFCDL